MPDGDSGSKQSGSQVTTSEPWSAVQPGLKTGISDIRKLYSKGGFQAANTPYSGQTVAGISPLTQQSWQGAQQFGTQGNAATNAGQDYITGLLSGDVSKIQPLIDNTKNAVNANFSAAGRYGSGAHDSALSQGIGTVIANQLGGAAQLAPQYSDVQRAQLDTLNRAGSQQQGQQQAELDAAQNLYYQRNQAPINALAQYLNLLSGVNTGGTSSTAMYGGGRTTGDYLMGGAGIAASLLGSYLGS